MQKRKVLLWCVFSVLALLLVGFICLPASGQVKDEKTPSTTITNTITSVPTDAPGENTASEPIKGIVVGANPKEHKVVIYARGGNTWYVQPTAASPLTDIGDDGKWESETHGGTDFAALVVKSSFKAKATLGKIPVVGGDVLAVAKKKPEKKTDK